jgi:hypothetical protein
VETGDVGSNKQVAWYPLTLAVEGKVAMLRVAKRLNSEKGHRMFQTKGLRLEDSGTRTCILLGSSEPELEPLTVDDCLIVRSHNKRLLVAAEIFAQFLLLRNRNTNKP